MLVTTNKLTPFKFPPVALVMINSRGKDNPWYKEALTSCENQIYPGELQLIIIDNNDKKSTIGKCWNEAVKQAWGCQYVCFVGDDDIISTDWVTASVIGMLEGEKTIEKCVCACTNVIRFDEQGGNAYAQVQPTGLWNREFLLNNPFNDKLPKKVDTELFERLKAKGYQPCVITYHFGYFERLHEGKVSGNKPLPKKQNMKQRHQQKSKTKVKQMHHER